MDIEININHSNIHFVEIIHIIIMQSLWLSIKTLWQITLPHCFFKRHLLT